MPPGPKKQSADTSANLGFEQKRWLTADKLRNNLRAEYALANPRFNDSDWFRKGDKRVLAN
jgi:hypothetical protein